MREAYRSLIYLICAGKISKTDARIKSGCIRVLTGLALVAGPRQQESPDHCVVSSRLHHQSVMFSFGLLCFLSLL